MTNKLYTLKDWRNDHVLKVKIGQYVDYGVINQLMEDVPPLTYNNGIFQPGEAYDHNVKTGEPLYQTFVEDGGYRYVGLCHQGSTVDETKDSYGYQRDRNKNNIQENKKHMKITEKELHNLISECVQEYIQENQLNEGFFDKLGFLGRSGANAAGNAAKKVGGAVSNAYNTAKTSVGNAYNNAKQAVSDYGQQMNQYSQNADAARQSSKNAKQATKLAQQIQQFLDLGILDGVAWGGRAKQQGMAFVKTLNALANSGFKAKATNYRNANNRMVAESSEKELEKIIKESIKKNLK